MWAHYPAAWWPSLWLSLWGYGLATATALQLLTTPALHARPRLRTPLLRLHVSTLKPSPTAGLKKRCEMRGCPLHLVKPGCEDS